MFSNIARSGAALAATVLGTLSLVADAGAANLNTHAATFSAYNAGQAAYVDYVGAGVRTGEPGGLWVIAPVVRSPVSTTYQNFYIDGDNANGSSTQFSLISHDYTGTLQQSLSFNESAASYSSFQTLNTISHYSYVSLIALLPGSYNGLVRGVTALD
jgi:hypothetical protein